MHAWTAAPVVDGLMGMMLMMMAVRIGTSMRWKWMSTKINIKAFWLKYYFNKKHFNNVQKSNESDFYSSQKQWAWPNIYRSQLTKMWANIILQSTALLINLRLLQKLYIWFFLVSMNSPCVLLQQAAFVPSWEQSCFCQHQVCVPFAVAFLS